MKASKAVKTALSCKPKQFIKEWNNIANYVV